MSFLYEAPLPATDDKRSADSSTPTSARTEAHRGPAAAKPLGFDALIDALGVNAGRLRPALPLGIIALFAAGMLSVALTETAVELFIGKWWLPVVICPTLWFVWTYWHSVLFGRHRERYLAASKHPYGAAFLRDILPGVCVGFSQMMRPMLNGGLLGDVWADPHRLVPANLPLAAFGVLLTAGAAAVFLRAFRTIGVANAGFVPEFSGFERFEPYRTGVYRRIRHPLFWAGIVGSVGTALILQHPSSLGVAFATVGYGLIYNKLEDRRLTSVFGRSYAEYAQDVPCCVPDLSAPAHRPEGPANDR